MRKYIDAITREEVSADERGRTIEVLHDEHAESLAEQNRREFDEFLEDEDGVELFYTGLWTRTLTDVKADRLRYTMERLTSSFSFEAVEVTVNNRPLAFAVTLPRIMIDFD